MESKNGLACLWVNTGENYRSYMYLGDLRNALVFEM